MKRNNGITKFAMFSMAALLLSMVLAPPAAADTVDDLFKKDNLFQKFLTKISSPLAQLIGLSLFIGALLILILFLGMNPENREQFVKMFWDLLEKLFLLMSWKVLVIIVIGIILALWGYTFLA